MILTDSQCITIFLSWLNDFLTIRAVADYYGMDDYTANDAITRGRCLYNQRSSHA